MLAQLAGVPVGMVEIIEQLTIAILCKGPSQKGLEPTTGGLTVGEQIWRSFRVLTNSSKQVVIMFSGAHGHFPVPNDAYQVT